MTNTKKKKKYKINILNILVYLSLLASIFLILNILKLKSIETVIRIIVIFIVLLIDLYFFRRNVKIKKNIKLFIPLMLLFIIANISGAFLINKVYSLIENTNKNKIIYSSSLIALNSANIDSVDDIYNKKIGIISNEKSIDNYIIANEIIEREKLSNDNSIIKFDDLQDMLRSLYKNEIDLMFISSDYKNMFNTIDEFANIENEVKVITNSEKSVKKKDTDDFIDSSGKDLTDAFSILIMGVDSTDEVLNKSTANGDSLILLTFNPSTLNATMVSIPRDSYVPIACFKNNRESKLTHAAWYGASCMSETIENFLGVKIDYYVKINFKGVVKLVNALGGVNVEVPKRLCTNSSNRDGEVCINGGFQNLDGEGALVLARNRYDLAGGDLDRCQNQQLLIKAMLDKMRTIRDISTFSNILETISNSIDTNLTTDQILSFYNVFKDIVKVGRINKDVIHFDRLYLYGTGQMIYDEASKMTLWNYVLNDESIESVKNAINNNLNKNPNLIKEFSYSISENYTSPIIGKDVDTKTIKYTLLPSFVGKDKSEVEKFIKENKIKVKYNEKIDNSSKYNSNSILSQNYPKNTRIDKIDTLEITVLKKTINEKIDCNINNTQEECKLPSLIGKTKDEVNSYFRNYKDSVNITFNEVTEALYPGKKIGTVVSQNYKVGTHLSKIQNLELSIIIK